MTRKKTTMVLTVSIPPEMSTAEARKEVRSLITHQSMWSSRWEEGDIKVRGLGPVPAAKKTPTEHLTKADLRWLRASTGGILLTYMGHAARGSLTDHEMAKLTRMRAMFLRLDDAIDAATVEGEYLS